MTRLGMMTVSAEHDRGAGKTLAYASDDALEQGNNLSLRRRLSGAHDRGDQPAELKLRGNIVLQGGLRGGLWCHIVPWAFVRYAEL